MKKFINIYHILHKDYGPQGWWPLIELGSIHYQPGDKKYGGYHPNDYSFPKTKNQVFEICVGSLLTQNTSWNGASKAILNLCKLNALDPERLLELNETSLKEAIRPAGYFNHKAKKLRIFTEFFVKLGDKIPEREELLELWGIGPETADSILLYAFNKPFFVVDAYTKRVFSRVGLLDKTATYQKTQELFMDNLTKDTKLFNEYHALIVEFGKNICQKRPFCDKCPIYKLCERNI